MSEQTNQALSDHFEFDRMYRAMSRREVHHRKSQPVAT